MSNLVDHARRELELCGQYKEDPAFAQSLVAAVAAFSTYGHSGGSAGIAIEMIAALLRFENLSPLTNNPEEWIRHTPDMWDGENHVWQNVRNGEAFSHDGGMTYTLMSEPKNERGRLPLHHSVVTHKAHWEKIVAQDVAQSIDHGEAYGVASASMAEPSDFSGGETDAAVGYRCVCGDIHRADDAIWGSEGHEEEANRG